MSQIDIEGPHKVVRASLWSYPSSGCPIHVFGPSSRLILVRGYTLFLQSRCAYAYGDRQTLERPTRRGVVIGALTRLLPPTLQALEFP